MRIEVAALRGYRLSALAMARGEHVVEEVADGESLAFVLLFGCVQITRSRSGQPASYCLHATRRKPLILVNPGSYCVVAEEYVLGFRGCRRSGGVT